MVELLANKAGSINGRVYDSTPFLYTEEHSADEHFGKVLQQIGLNYYGVERMYSGFSGEELEAEIFFGPIYYQRLRHMVSDKYQARSSHGPNDPLTSQESYKITIHHYFRPSMPEIFLCLSDEKPVKGRSRGGGVRMGEMERDGILSHGCAHILRDRLFQCSDFHIVNLCSVCGSLLAPTGIAL